MTDARGNYRFSCVPDARTYAAVCCCKQPWSVFVPEDRENHAKIGCQLRYQEKVIDGLPRYIHTVVRTQKVILWRPSTANHRMRQEALLVLTNGPVCSNSTSAHPSILPDRRFKLLFRLRASCALQYRMLLQDLGPCTASSLAGLSASVLQCRKPSSAKGRSTLPDLMS